MLAESVRGIDVFHRRKIDAVPIGRGGKLRPLVRPGNCHRRLLALHEVERRFGLEGRLQHQRAACGERAADRHAEIARKEESVCRPCARVRAGLVETLPAPQLQGHRSVSAEDALRLGGRTRREEQHGGVGRRDGGRRRIQQRGRHGVSPRKELLPVLDRALAAADGSDMAQERQPGRRNFARRGRGDLRLDVGKHLGKVFLQDAPLHQQHRNARASSRCSNSAVVEKVLSAVATPPAMAAPQTAERNSGRLVISTPTRVPLPVPQASSARATRRASLHQLAIGPRYALAVARRTRAPRVRRPPRRPAPASH